MPPAATAHSTQLQPVMNPAQVAVLLDAWADADQAVAAELDELATARSLVSRATVVRVERLLEEVLRPAVTVRERLAGLPRDLLGQALALRHDLHQPTDRAAS